MRRSTGAWLTSARRSPSAVRIGAMSPRQARTLLSEQTAGVDAFMRRPYRTTNQ
jgi:hypothetical protein